MELSMLTILFIVLVMAGFIGYFVVWGVTPALHTPLMAVTNAISGIVIVAAILIAGMSGDGGLPESIAHALPIATPSEDKIQLAKILGFIGVTLASINIFGGFAITTRMLSMFKKKGK